MSGIERGGERPSSPERWKPTDPADQGESNVPEPESLKEATPPQDTQFEPAIADDRTIAGTGAVAVDGANQAGQERLDRGIGATALSGTEMADQRTADQIGQSATAGSVDHVPVQDTDNAPLIDLTDETPYPSDHADARAAAWEQQGNNDAGYEGTCGLASSAEAISDLTGEPVTEREVVDYARQEGLCVSDSSDPARLGGTDLGQIQAIHEEAGLDSEVRHGMTQGDLAREVDDGSGVIAAVRASEVWPAESCGGPDTQAADRSQPGTDHAVWVTGVSRSPEGRVSGFYTNDTGMPEGAGRFVPSTDMAAGWEERGGEAVVSRRNNQ